MARGLHWTGKECKKLRGSHGKACFLAMAEQSFWLRRAAEHNRGRRKEEEDEETSSCRAGAILLLFFSSIDRKSVV